MTKSSVILYILKRRVSNILLLSIMFSSLIVILMVGTGVKGLFYDYLSSNYGNIPDLKIKLSNINDERMDKLLSEIREEFSDEELDILHGYESVEKVSIVDSEELLLTSGLPLFIKGIRFSDKLKVLVDDKEHDLKVNQVSYQDELFIELDLGELSLKNPQSIKFIASNEILEYGFCKRIEIDETTLTLRAVTCRDRVDELLKTLDELSVKSIKLEIDGKVMSSDVIFSDTQYKSLILSANNITKADKLSLAYKDTEIDFSSVESHEISNNELIINFYQDSTKVKNYKRFLSLLLRDFVNYNRMVLKLNIHSFENDDEDDKKDAYMIYLDELTDIVDIIFAKDMGNLAISSSHLAQDLNNFAVLDDFNVIIQENEFKTNIRSTIKYSPEEHYDRNILILNREVLTKNLGLDSVNNFIDIYSSAFDSSDNMEALQKILNRHDKFHELIFQEEIIPSIKPKQNLFNISVIVITIFILVVLFIAMYIVLIQFYSNFYSELSLLKLYGSKVAYQAYINMASFIISAGINYIYMLKQEALINSIMQKYFFVSYEISIDDFFLSLSILFIFIIIIYFLERKEIQKLNLIRGQ